jgi:hypothetical protein
MLTTAALRSSTRPRPRLRDTPGSRLRLLVVSTGQTHCVGIDLASGALVRAWSPVPVDQRLHPYDLVEVTVGNDPDVVPDPSEPDAVAIAAPPVPVGRMTGRRALRLARPLLHPDGAPLLGFHGPTVPFWERRPDHPSVALAEPKEPVVVTVDAAGMWCHFMWRGRPQVLECRDPRLGAFLARVRRDAVSLSAGTLLLVALEPPVQGQCHKVIEALVPRR